MTEDQVKVMIESGEIKDDTIGGVIEEGPDSLGRYMYRLRFWRYYHPGHPDGEYRWAERGQYFRAPLFDLPHGLEWNDIR